MGKFVITARKKQEVQFSLKGGIGQEIFGNEG